MSWVLLKMVAMATAHILLMFWFKSLIALSSAVPALWWKRFDFQASASFKFLFPSVQCTKVLTVNSCFQFFLQALPGITFFRNRLGGQIFLCHVTDVKCYHFLVHIFTTLLVFDQRECLFNTSQSRNFLLKSVGTKLDFWEKCAWRFLHDGWRI